MLNLQFIMLYFRYMWGKGGWLKPSYEGEGLAENVRIPSYRGKGYKIAKKCHMIFERFRTCN